MGDTTNSGSVAPSCGTCGEANREGAAFCGSCGSPLRRVCSSCRADLPAGLKFCDQCGTPVESPAPPDNAPNATGPAGDRKVVTILFADLSGSTQMQERLDAEAAARVMERVQRMFATAVGSNGGRVVKSTGDGVMAVFGVPAVREDDAVRAVRAGIDMQAAFASLELDDVALRVGINTGEVVVSPASDDVIGDPVNVAARLEGAAGLGEVFVGPETTRLVRDVIPLETVEPLQLKGKAEAVQAARVAGHAVESSVRTTSFLGREEDLASLLDALAEAEANCASRLVTVVGWPGLGKSRLAAEFAAEVDGRASVIEVRFVHGGGSSFGPIASALRALVESGDLDFAEDRGRVTDTIDALVRGGQAGSTEQVFWAIRRVLQAAAAMRPVVVVLDDIHWAETAMLDLIEHLAEWLSGGAVLLLALARPELRDRRPALIEAGGPSAAVRVLSGLDTDTCRALALEVLDADEVPDEVVRRVLEGSEGNPLFLRELLRLLVDDGVLERSPDGAARRWTLTVEIDAIELPATIHAALAARIEQLSSDERAVLQAASVIGRHFERGAVEALVAPAVATRLDDHLASLHRRALVDPDGTWWRDERLFHFHHVLIRDAAYRRILKEVRAAQHVRYADWLVERVGDDTAEYDEVLAYHLEQAVTYQRELGDTVDPALAKRAVAHLSAAGGRALARDDVANASALLGRARQLAPDDVELLRTWCEAVVSTGDMHAATMAVSELASAARDDRERAIAAVYDAQLAGQRTPEKLRDVVGKASTAAVILSEHGDDVGVAHAEAVHASALAGLGQVGAAEAALDRSLAAARRAGDIRRANVVLSLAPAAAVWGPSPIARASGRCLDVVRVLRITTWAPHVEAHALRHQAALEAMRQRGDAARNMLTSARQTFTDLGHRLGLLETTMYEGLVELLDGNAASAEPPLRKALTGFDSLGARTSAARATALLARALLELDRVDEAARLADPLLAGEDLKAKIGLLGVAAEVLARRGEIADAEGLARGAVALAEATDALVDHADARLALANVFAAAGRTEESDAELARARDLYEAKGATAGMARAHGPVEGAQAQIAESVRVERRVQPNAVTRLAERWDRAVREGDMETLASLYAPSFVYDDHTIRAGEEAESHVSGLSEAFASAAAVRNEMMASLGQRHAMWRATMTIRGAEDEDVSELVRINVGRADNEGRFLRTDGFGEDALNEALACLVKLWAEDECDGAARERAATTAECFRLATGPAHDRDWERYGNIFERDCVVVDHRAHGHEVKGQAAVVEFVRSFAESTDRIVMRTVDVLALTPHATLWRWEATGELGGGEFALPALLVGQIGLSGRLCRLELFRPDSADAAWRCFDRLAVGGGPTKRRVRRNSAVANAEAWHHAMSRGDHAAARALLAPTRILANHRLDHQEEHDGLNEVSTARIEEPGVTVDQEVLASLGERHVMVRRVWRFPAGTEYGIVETHNVGVIRVDEAGLVSRTDAFDGTQDLSPALACFLERWAEDELSGREAERIGVVARTCASTKAYTDGDWETLGSLYALDATLVDHRTRAAGEVQGRDQIVEHLRLFRDSCDEAELRTDDVLGYDEWRALLQVSVHGRKGGGRFELPGLAVMKPGADGLTERVEVFTLEDADDAWACFDRLGDGEGPSERRRIVRPNVASDLAQRWAAAFNRRDLDAANALRAHGYERIDHFWHHVVDRPTAVALDDVTSVDGSALIDCIATLGERHALFRLRFNVADSVTERYFLTRADASRERIELDELFGPESLVEALTCLFQRWGETELEGNDRARAEQVARWWSYGDLVVAHDWNAYQDLLALDAVLLDHRSNEEFQGADQLTAWIRELAALTHSLRMRPTDVLALTPGVTLIENAFTGEAAGGSFDRSSYLVARFDDDGRMDRVEVFPLEQLDEAWACFDRHTAARIASATAPYPDGPAPTAALRAVEQWTAALEHGNSELIAEMLAPDVRDDDRRPITGGLFVGREAVTEIGMSIANAPRLESVSVSPLATRGERVAMTVVRVRFGTGAAVEVNIIAVFVADDQDRLASIVVFDPDAEDAAYDELERAALESLAPEAALAAAACTEVTAAYNSGDLERLRRAFTPDARIVDRRNVGWGDLDVESYLTGVASLRDRSPDARMRVVEWLHVDDHCVAMRLRIDGTSDGAAFESPITSLRWCDGDRVSRIELYDVADPSSVVRRLVGPAPAPRSR